MKSGELSFFEHNGRWIPTGNTDGVQELATWLDNDVVDKNTVSWFVQQLNNFDYSVKKSNFIGSGNADHVFSTGDHIFLMCEYVDYQKVLLTKDQCLIALEHYRTFLSSKHKTPLSKPESIDVIYIAEGEDAMAKFIKLGGILKA